jgi:hypothetical protein
MQGMQRGPPGGSIGQVARYRIVVRGRLTSRLASTIAGVEIEQCEDDTTLLASIATSDELDALLERLGDVGIEVVSLGQEPERA